MSGYKVKYTIGISIYSMFCALVVLMQSSGLLVLKIENASVFLALLLAVYAGYYFGEYGAAVIGLLMGAATDVYSSTYCFNTLMLTVIGFVSGILISYLFNRNFSAAVVLNIVASAVYFFMKWLIVYAFSDPAAGFVLVSFTLPSFLFTGVVGILTYFIINPILKRIPVIPYKR